VLQCVAVCCSVLQCAAVCCSVLQRVAVCCSVLQCAAVCCSVLQCVAVCCSVLQCVAVRCSVLQCVAVCYSVLHCVTVRCSVLQCVAPLRQPLLVSMKRNIGTPHTAPHYKTHNNTSDKAPTNKSCSLSRQLLYRVAKTHRMPYLCRSLSTKEPCKQWLFPEK